MLFPRESETREVKNLSGIWRFKADYANTGYEECWQERTLADTIPMPVPSSYNDITQNPRLRDHIGVVWYETAFFVPLAWSERRVFIRFGSAAHAARAWINGTEAVSHEGGFLPFEADISDLLSFGAENRLTVAVDNRLSWQTLPTGTVRSHSDEDHPAGYATLEYHFDFFNYAGIHRPVKLYTVSETHIRDIWTAVRFAGDFGRLSYRIEAAGKPSRIQVKLISPAGDVAAVVEGDQGVLEVRNPERWAPGRGVLYTMRVEALDGSGAVADVYREHVGFREIAVENNRFLINSKPFYFRGFGKHEDWVIKGRGYDDALAVKDANLLKWIGANSYRTSHYPYAEELLELADREGLVIIDELPAVGMHFFDKNRSVFCEDTVNDETLRTHVRTLEELIARDKNHPSVVMWSLSNEAATYEENAVPYFQAVVRRARELDDRPLTLAHCPVVDECRVAHLFDVLCLNRYYAWYFDPGHLELIERQLERNLKAWYDRFQKPLIISEYGADTVAGMHSDPPVMFSEEFQVQFLDAYHKVFDRLPFVIGEHVWNFADFGTKQGTVRVMGNRKGVFTRDRQPKSAAHLLRARWTPS